MPPHASSPSDHRIGWKWLAAANLWICDTRRVIRTIGTDMLHSQRTMTGIPEQKRVLITVRTYPTPAKKGVEVSCTAGVTDTGEWIRLYPVPYRTMPLDQRFRKYQWVDLRVTRASDPRPESYTPDIDSISIVRQAPSSNNWAERKSTVYRLRSHCLCCLEEERNKHGFPTLGLFKPLVIQRLVIEPDDPEWSEEQLARLSQLSLLNHNPAQKLEKIPFKFKYEFRCDDGDCGGHSISCTDWEMAESYRKWRRNYGASWEQKFRNRYEMEMIQKNDTHFYVGTLRGHPATWLIVGLFYPRK